MRQFKIIITRYFSYQHPLQQLASFRWPTVSHMPPHPTLGIVAIGLVVLNFGNFRIISPAFEDYFGPERPKVDCPALKVLKKIRKT